VARLGIARTLQTPRSFPSMSVLENVAVGAVFGKAHGSAQDALRSLKLVGLGRRRHSPMSSLNLQERKAVELARALAMAPQVVLIDEAMSGLNPTEIEDSMRLIRRVRDETGVTIIWVEHVVKAIMAVVERILVLHFGSLIAAGAPAEIAANAAVVEAYLGQPA
jgi:branched-chain amino acid transport system ATP-binding protein